MARAGDAGLIACLYVAPLVFGGRHDLGVLVYLACVAVAAIGVVGAGALEGRRVGLSASAKAILVAALALTALQVVPLPPAVIATLAPDMATTLPLWTEGGPFQAWRTLSVAPAETRGSLALLSGHALLFLAVAARLRSADDVRWLLRRIAGAAVFAGLLGVVLYAAGNGKLLWVYSGARPLGGAMQSTFANKNHFGHFLILGLGPLVWWLWESRQGGARQRPRGVSSGSGSLAPAEVGMVAAALALVTIVLATQSRGAAVALAAATAVGALVSWRAGHLDARRVVMVALLVVAAVFGLSLFDSDRVGDRLGDLVSGEIDRLDEGHARRSIWGANAEAFASRPWVGYGVGAHRDYAPLFLDFPVAKEFTHAESGYFQLASEAGLAGLVLLAAAIVVCVWWIVRGSASSVPSERHLMMAALAPGLTASVVHSLVDFVWYTPVLTGGVLMLAAAAMRLSEQRADGVATEPVPAGDAASFGAFARLGVVTCAASFAVGTVLGPGRAATEWDAYLRCSAQLKALSQQLVRGDGAGSHEMLPAVIERQTERAVDLLRGVIDRNEKNARAHLRLAGRCLQLFEIRAAAADNPMPVAMLRDAVIQSRFANARAVRDWLRKAIGDRLDLLLEARRHAELAVRLGPLHGEGYLYLANLAFLDAAGNEAIAALVDQALLVRPHDGGVLFEAGRQKHLLGHHEEGAVHWRECLSRPGSHREKLVALLAMTTPAESFVERYSPDRATIDLAIVHYRANGSDDDLVSLCEYAADAADAATQSGEESPVAIARRWRQVSELMRSVGRPDEAARYALLGYEQLPHDFGVRFEAGVALHAAERYEEADPHLRWCLARRPDLPRLHGLLASCSEMRSSVAQARQRRREESQSLSTGNAPDAIPRALRRLPPGLGSGESAPPPRRTAVYPVTSPR